MLGVCPAVGGGGGGVDVEVSIWSVHILVNFVTRSALQKCELNYNSWPQFVLTNRQLFPIHSHFRKSSPLHFIQKAGAALVKTITSLLKCPSEIVENGISDISKFSGGMPQNPLVWSLFGVRHFLRVRTSSKSHAAPLLSKQKKKGRQWTPSGFHDRQTRPMVVILITSVAFRPHLFEMND